MDHLGGIRQHFSEELGDLEKAILEMASLADIMFRDAVESLAKLDPDLALDVCKRDDDIDRRDVDIEIACLRMLALRQPLARDLRAIGTAMKMITDIERIGDLSVDIAKTTMKIEKEVGDTDYADFQQMAAVARGMLLDCLEAYIRADIEAAAKVIRTDDEVDELYRTIRGQIHQYMVEHPEQVVAASWLLLAIHHIERVADHTVNIAERVRFMETGVLEQTEGPYRPDH